VHRLREKRDPSTASRAVYCPPHPITSTLTTLMNHFGATVEIDGNLTCEEDLTIEGHLTGNIEVRDAMLIVAPPSVLEATVRAKRVIVQGMVKGSISAGERIELAESANVVGDLSATQVVIADGAQFNGRVNVEPRNVATIVPKQR
jgi:cytoskeletal protein CcmA (bactofilin family)